MDIAATKLALMQRLMAIMDERTLRNVADFFKRELPATADEHDELTEEEVAGFEEELARRDRGETTFHTAEESIRLIRQDIKE